MYSSLAIIGAYNDTLKVIESAGRTCWDSTSKIDETSSERFVSGIVARGHESVLEHSRVILGLPLGMEKRLASWIALSDAEVQMSNNWEVRQTYFSSNLRGLRDLVRFMQDSDADVLDPREAEEVGAEIAEVLYGILPSLSLGLTRSGSGLRLPEGVRRSGIGVTCADLEVQTRATLIPDIPRAHRLLHGAMTIRVRGISRIVSHEWVRHRKTFSFSQRSQRYVLERRPDYVTPDSIMHGNSPDAVYKDAMEFAWGVYQGLAEDYTKQDARYVLPGGCTTEMVVTSTWKWWSHFLKLRTAPAALPEMRHVAKLVGRAAAAAFHEEFGDYDMHKGAD